MEAPEPRLTKDARDATNAENPALRLVVFLSFTVILTLAPICAQILKISISTSTSLISAGYQIVSSGILFIVGTTYCSTSIADLFTRKNPLTEKDIIIVCPLCVLSIIGALLYGTIQFDGSTPRPTPRPADFSLVVYGSFTHLGASLICSFYALINSNKK